MKMQEKNEFLQVNMKGLEKHFEQVKCATEKLKPYLPFLLEKVKSLTSDEMISHDVLIYKFNQIYDALTGRVFSLLLDMMHEQSDGPDLIDRLALLKKLKIIDFMGEWKKLHKLRRCLHRYTNDPERQAEYLNALHKSVPLLVSTFERIKKRIAQLPVR